VRYKPFGEARDAATNLQTDRKFTGQTEDAASGLYFYGARYHATGSSSSPASSCVLASYA
jgi:RHS repeat-associated protein